MSCKCFKQIGDFPEEWRHVLAALQVKEELRTKLQSAKYFNWTDEIIRLTMEIGSLLAGLPEDIKNQYLRIKKKEEYRLKWADAVASGNKKEADMWSDKYKNVFKCNGG